MRDINGVLKFDARHSPRALSEKAGISELRPGNYLTEAHCRIGESREYWNFGHRKSRQVFDYSVIRQALRKVLVGSVEESMAAGASIGTILNGGIDSTIVASSASKISWETNL